MDQDRARSLISAERTRVQRLLSGSDADQHQDQADEDQPDDSGDRAQALTAEGVQGAVSEGLRERLAALDRAEQRLGTSAFGRSVRSGLPIPEERLEADPAAELTVEEAGVRSD